MTAAQGALAAAHWGDITLALVLILLGWVVGMSMGFRARPDRLHAPDEVHPALDGPIGVIVKHGKVRR